MGDVVTENAMKTSEILYTFTIKICLSSPIDFYTLRLTKKIHLTLQTKLVNLHEVIRRYYLLYLFFRIFWMSIFLLSFFGMMMILKGSYESFQNNAISFVTETTYLDWNTTFPAVSICEITGSEVNWPAYRI